MIRLGDETADHAIAGVMRQRQRGITTARSDWRDHYDPDQQPRSDAQRDEVARIGIDEWRTAEAYRAHRRAVRGNRR
ncbi:hypothetical protein [Gordonia sp. DT101]|uniref:hypothetical protein n=1 Tax=Gordonia sp. DT101 TaxID=3416545 RepID=UPI003CECFC40